MEISIYHKAFNVILSPMARILLATGVLLSACADSEQAPSPVPEHTATLQLVFKQQGSADGSSPTQLKGTGSFATDAPLTVYAETDAPLTMDAAMPASRGPMTRAVNETDIQTVDVLSFKVNPLDPTNIKEGTFFYRSIGTYTQTSPGQGKVEVKLVDSPEAQTLVVLANVRTQVDALDATYGEQKEAVMARLLLPATADGTPDFAKGMPMWGELPNEVVGEGFSPSGAPKEVTMIRSVVKFTYREKTDYLYSPSGANLWYNGLSFEAYNFRSKGRVAPDNFRPSLSVATPTIPAGATQAQGTHHTLSPSYVSLVGLGGEVSFYMFESDNSKANTGSALDATCLVVHFLGGPATGWHRLDFRDYAQPAGTGFMDLLRGHHYVIEPEEWDGTGGALTAEEAFKGVSKIKCRIVPWNEVQEEVKVPGNKRLSVDTRSIRMSGASAISTGKTLTVTTENTQGWTITDVPSWLTVSPTSSITDNTSSVTVKSNGSGTGIINSGSFKLKAGNAEMAIRVILGKVPLEYVAEYNLAGGYQYGSSFSSSSPGGAVPTPAQIDEQLRWATSHNNDQSGYYNWYVCKGETNSIYNPTGKHLFDDSFFSPGNPGHGYHLPSRQELTGVFSYSYNAQYGGSTNQSVNEACEFGGIKKTYLNTYFSSGDGVCYAIRFKAATGNPNDGSSLSEFPKAEDKNMRCAYRYTRVESFAYDNNLTSRLKVDCVYLGEAGASTVIDDIKEDSWWTSHSAEIVTRIFPAAGYIYPAPVSGSGSLRYRGDSGYYWSGTELNSSFAWSAYFHSGSANASSSNDKFLGFAVRLFSSE
ncbi:BACON domain-containing protein [Bacteroides pyogenes]|uniref:BACON domain-containing protein n=1 Tax=Bacteroides pyogenes TaxID=310300 RepID=UPI002FD93920